jgi:hypothetical protein
MKKPILFGFLIVVLLVSGQGCEQQNQNRIDKDVNNIKEINKEDAINIVKAFLLEKDYNFKVIGAYKTTNSWTVDISISGDSMAIQVNSLDGHLECLIDAGQKQCGDAIFQGF